MKKREWKIADGGWNGRAGSALPAGGASPAARRGLLASLGVSVVIPGLGFTALAQYAINWHTIDGGGGTSTNGQYDISGTIGQPDAGAPMTNGQYAVTGGFWVLPTAIQTPDAPTLMIAPAGAGQAQISWTPNTPGFVLQETLSLSPPNWVNSPSGATNPVFVPTTITKKFYRLSQP